MLDVVLPAEVSRKDRIDAAGLDAVLGLRG